MNPVHPELASATARTGGAAPEVDASASPLVHVLLFAALNSFAAGIATNAIFFVAEQGYGFGPVPNYALGLLMGATYVAGALLAGPAMRRVQAHRPQLRGRGVLRVLVLGMGLIALLPLVPGVGSAGPWLFIALYSPLCGALWPVVESYVSGGRSGTALRAAIGRFNVTWSFTTAAGYWAIAPLLEGGRAPLVWAAMAACQIGSAALLPRLRADAGRHAPEHHVVPDSYPALLRAHRVLLVVSYLVMYALSPYLPALLHRLGVTGGAAPLVASTWLVARVVTFAAMERCHGWHGRWSTAGIGLLLLGVGFAGALFSPAAPQGVEVPACSIALFLFGTGAAVLYCAALYYVLAVGAAEVDAGGSHEALIGVGYTAGPLLGLLACGAVELDWIQESARESATLGAVTVASLLLLVLLRRR